MEVQLYVYDLTRGMARNLSQSFLGIQIDAVYHTSLVFNKTEYFFGRGIQTCLPGSTHHGQPMEIVPMGTTHLPLETILEYLDSLEEIYSPESYDLFAHNCNNFTNDFAMFLVGRGIPEHITNLPRRVLDTPMGAMLKAQIDSSMRSITQGGQAPRRRVRSSPMDGSAPSSSTPTAISQNGAAPVQNGAFGRVLEVTDKTTLDKHLKSAASTAATIFFTSATCAPCKIAYPMFDQLAEHHSQALFLKVDISKAREIAMAYQIRATPTFITFTRGQRQNSWSGADPNLLKSNVDHLMQLTFPPHPHTLLKVPTLQHGSLSPVTYTRIPPLDKLAAKLGPAASDKDLLALRSFVEKRGKNPKDATLPDLTTIGRDFPAKLIALNGEVRFAAVDLLRCAMVDPRVGGFFAEQSSNPTIPAILKIVNDLDDCPHNLRLVTLHLACNTFISPLHTKELLRGNNPLVSSIIQLITSSLLGASHSTTRVAAASLAFNLAVTNYRIRREEAREAMDETEQVELAAALLETLSREENDDAVKTVLNALGYIFYCAPSEGELVDLATTLDARSIVESCPGQGELVREVASLI